MKKIIQIGGGHGSSYTLGILRGMSSNITGIISTSDSGGSSGKLRDDFLMPALGDIRNCLIALSNEPGQASIFSHRFPAKTSLSGHNLGNLILAFFYQKK